MTIFQNPPVLICRRPFNFLWKRLEIQVLKKAGTVEDSKSGVRTEIVNIPAEKLRDVICSHIRVRRT